MNLFVQKETAGRINQELAALVELLFTERREAGSSRWTGCVGKCGTSQSVLLHTVLTLGTKFKITKKQGLERGAL